MESFSFVKVAVVLCAFGFFREMRPSEPFVTEYLSSTEWRNITSEQLNRDVYPIGTYSYLGLLILVFLVTDILRYKPVIILSGCLGILIWSLLLWTYSLQSLQVVQFLYGMYMSAEVAYYTYIYARVEKDKYQKATGLVRASTLTGRFLASLIGQLLISYSLMELRELNYLTLIAQTISLVLALLLPNVRVSVYFYATKEDDQERTHFSFSRAVRLLWAHFVSSYSNVAVLESSLWWALAMCGFIQIQSYVQLLWQEIDAERETLLNGGVEALLTVLGALSALVAGSLRMAVFDRFSLWILSACAVLEGALILVSAYTSNVAVAYATYVAFGVLYMFMITIVSASVAKHLADDSFALVFGINTFLALLFQTVLTLVVVSESGLALSTRGQFTVYGYYFIGLAVIYLCVALLRLLTVRGNKIYPVPT